MDPKHAELSRREFTYGAAVGAAGLAVGGRRVFAAEPPQQDPVIAKITEQHAATVTMLQQWIALPSIANDNLNYPEGAEHLIKLARDAGFQQAELVPISSKRPGVFATLDAGAKSWLAVYFMYDVKHYDASEWSSPPLEARIVDRPGVGKVMIGRGTSNQKGPQVALLAALHAFKAAGKPVPVNLVLIAEGEEEIGSPNFREIVFKPQVEAALKKCAGIILPGGNQGLDGSVEQELGAKGVIEIELVASGAKWGRGPTRDVHSSLNAQLDAPVWRLVKALNTLVGPDGHTPVVKGFFDKVRPITAGERKVLDASIPRRSEAEAKKALGATRWFNDEPWPKSLERLASQPTINIEGLVAGYTGPGGKTVLPHRGAAKLDIRLVPNMTAKGTLELIKQHLATNGFGDVEVLFHGGYDPTETPLESKLMQAAIATYKKMGIDPLLWPRSAGSWPGITFTGKPLELAASSFGLGHGDGAHAPNEYWLVESANPKVMGMDGAARSFVELLYLLGR